MTGHALCRRENAGAASRGDDFPKRDLMVRQRTQLINALRGHLAEYGVVAATGATQLKKLEAGLEIAGAELPSAVRDVARIYL